MLTVHQRRALDVIDQRIQATGVAPSYAEMQEALGLGSKGGVNRLVVALEERGFIRRLPHRARAMEVLRRPAEPASAPPPDLVAAARWLVEQVDAPAFGGGNPAEQARIIARGIARLRAALPLAASQEP